MEKTIVFASHNKDKTREVRDMLTPLGYKVLSISDLDLSERKEETAETFEGNSLIKAQDIAEQCTYAVLSDDSGLSITALDGFPGVHSARFMENESYTAKNLKLIEMLKDKKNREAFFVTAMTYISKDRKTIKTFVGKDRGYITEELTKEEQNGFGYDPIFFSYDLNKTYGNATEEEKNSVSHRGRALRQVIDYLKEENK